MPAPSDTEHLVAAARDGDRTALDALYARHQGRLLSFVRARMPPWLAQRVAPDDVLQETLLESARKIGAFEPGEPAAFYRWLVAIARFKLAEAERAQRAHKRSPADGLDSGIPADQTSLAGRAARGERADRLHAALRELPERRAEAVRLRYLEGLSVAETGERLGVSPAAVKALVARGLGELAERGLGES